MPTPLIIGPMEEAAFAELQEKASQNPLDMKQVMRTLDSPAGFEAHMRQMGKQSVRLPLGYVVTFSIEEGHPIGTCRHLSMSAPSANKVPSPQAVWMVAEYLGFKGGLEACEIWEEDFDNGHTAINIVQPLTN